MENNMNHEATQKRIMQDVTKAIETDCCPKCNLRLKKSLVYINKSDVVESCEMECPGCHWQVGFGPVLTDAEKFEFAGCSPSE